jgi:hypothetical protein
MLFRGCELQIITVIFPRGSPFHGNKRSLFEFCDHEQLDFGAVQHRNDGPFLFVNGARSMYTSTSLVVVISDMLL